MILGRAKLRWRLFQVAMKSVEMKTLLLLSALTFAASAYAQEPQRIFVQNHIPSVESELAKRCAKKVTVTAVEGKADYILHFNVSGNDFTLFNRNGDLILRGKATFFSNAIEKVCKAIK